MKEKLNGYDNGDLLKELVRTAREAVRSGKYSAVPISAEKRSLKASILEAKASPIIAEIKFASPTAGSIREKSEVSNLAKSFERGGAIALSILVEKEHFNGELEYLSEAKLSTSLPILMKDIIIDPVQIEAGRKLGADAVLLIMSIYKRGYSEYSLDYMIDKAHEQGLEVLLEVHSKDEFFESQYTRADIVGVNNRNLSTFKTDLAVSAAMMTAGTRIEKPLIAESGIRAPSDIQRLYTLGYQGFLIGTAIMSSADPEAKLRSLVLAIDGNTLNSG